MSVDKGKRPPHAFTAPPGTPIVGQPFAIKSWFATVLLDCHCGAHEVVMIPQGAASQCPACKKVYTIQSVQTAAGGINFGIGMIAPPEAADGTGAIHE